MSFLDRVKQAVTFVLCSLVERLILLQRLASIHFRLCKLLGIIEIIRDVFNLFVEIAVGSDNTPFRGHRVKILWGDEYSIVSVYIILLNVNSFVLVFKSCCVVALFDVLRILPLFVVLGQVTINDMISHDFLHLVCIGILHRNVRGF